MHFDAGLAAEESSVVTVIIILLYFPPYFFLGRSIAVVASEQSLSFSASPSRWRRTNLANGGVGPISPTAASVQSRQRRRRSNLANGGVGR